MTEVFRVMATFVALAVLAVLYQRPAASMIAELSSYERDPFAAERNWVETTLPRDRRAVVEAYTPYLDGRSNQLTAYPFLLNLDPSEVTDFDFAILTRNGSGRFFRGDYETQRDRFDVIQKAACETFSYPEGAARFEVLIFQFDC